MALPPAFLDELKARLSIAQVVGRHVTWDQRKSNASRGDWWAPCPFHTEKTASFHVDDAKGFYHCFGCQASGDVVGFVRETENLGFMEAVELLAAEAGMPLPERSPAAAAAEVARRGLVEAMEAAVQFYRLQLNTARAAETRGYLDRRGLTPATRERFELGFAPDGRRALQDHLAGRGFGADVLAEAGLTKRPDDGGAPYDSFRGRLMFPIRDARGRAIAFGARALRDGQQPKYLNSPQTPLFDKGRTLYNAAQARAAAGRAGTVIVAEGYMDVIALAQAGFDHAVAPLGTAITADQLALVWRLAPEPIVALDGDDAGLDAAHRLVDLALPLLEPVRALRFVRLPAGQDPDDVLRAGGSEAMARLLAATEPMIDLLWARETARARLDSPERRSALDARLRRLLERIADPGLRAHYRAEFAARRADLLPAPPRPAARAPQTGRGAAAPGRFAPRPPASPMPATRASPLAGDAPDAEARIRECAILTGCLNHPEVAADLEDRLERLAFSCASLREIRDALLPLLHASPSADDVRAGVARRIGRDPFRELLAPGQVRANRRIAADAAPADAARAVEEELRRHAALAGRLEEMREAERALTEAAAGPADEGLTWRLQQAALAVQEAERRPLSESAGLDAEAETAVSQQLEALIAGEVWRRTPRR